MGELQGMVAVVTGASSGIGAATAEALADAGASIVLAARRTRMLEEMTARVKLRGGRARAIACDVRNEEQAHSLIERTVEEFGQLDIVVNNAGVMLQSRIERNLSDEWRQMFETNVLGMLYVTAASIAYLRRSKGQIVNISSVAGRKARERGGVYSATKWAVNAISESLRLELLADHIRVLVIEPGTTETELVNHITDAESLAAQVDNMKQLTPLQPRDVADAIVWSLCRPRHVAVHEVLIRPDQQVF